MFMNGRVSVYQLYQVTEAIKVPFHQSRVLHKLLRTFCAELFLCTYKRTPLVDHVSTD